jgi:hypothetical protein
LTCLCPIRRRSQSSHRDAPRGSNRETLRRHLDSADRPCSAPLHARGPRPAPAPPRPRRCLLFTGHVAS